MNKESKSSAGIESKSRRKAVKTIVGGVTAVAAYNALPAKWGTPLIEQVFLPVHAATSGTTLNDPCEVTLVSGTQDSDTVVVDITGFVTPPVGNLPTTIVATGSPDSSATATITTTTAADGTFSGRATLTTSSGLATVLVTTTVQGAVGSANCKVDVPQRVNSCGEIDFQVFNESNSNVTVTYDNCTSSDNEFVIADDSSRNFDVGGNGGVHPTRNVTLSSNGENLRIDDGDGFENWDGSNREINPAEHPTVIVDEQLDEPEQPF